MLRLVTLISLLSLLAGPLLAQTSTGRHRRPSGEDEQPRAEETRGVDQRVWYVALGAGLMTSGDLVRIRTLNGGDQAWEPPGGQPFSSADYVLTLDESVGLAVALGRRLGPRFSARLDFSAAELSVSALARVGESAEVYRWDELSVLMLGLTAEYRLTESLSHFYLLAGGVMTSVEGSSSDAYDQTLAGLRFGGGYQQHLGGDWNVRGEIRDTVQSLDLADYRPPVPEGGVYPGIQTEEMGPQHLVELLVMLQGQF